MNRRPFLASVGAALAALAVPRSLFSAAPAAPPHPAGRVLMRMTLRATRHFDEFPMEAGESVVISYDDHFLGRHPLRITFEDCVEGPMSREDARIVVDGLRDGGLVFVTPPSPDEMLEVIERQLATANARLAQLRSAAVRVDA